MPPVNPAQLPKLFQEARRHQAAGRWAQARETLETILATKPDLAEAQFNMAQVLLKLEDPISAAQHLDRAADLKPDEPAIWKQYATTVQWLADPIATAAFLEKAKKARIDRSLLISLQETFKPKTSKSKVSLGSAPPGEVQRAIGYLREGRFKEARATASKLSRAHPKVAIIADILAYAQQELGDAAGAEENFRRSIQLDPGYAEARANFGQFLLRQKRYDESIAELRNALRILPEMPIALLSLGTALHWKFRFPQAIRFLKRAVMLDPMNATARIELAECLLADRKPADAMEFLRPILDTVMPNAKNRVLYAQGMADLQQNEEALAAFESAESVATVKLFAKTSKATFLQTLGRFEEAEAIFREVINDDPLVGKAYSTFLVTKKLTADDPLIAKMQTVYDHPDLTDESRAYLGFALAKVMEDTKDFDHVFPYLRAANDQMRAMHPYDIAERIKSNRELTDHFRAVDFDAAAQHATSDFQPVFVTGLPRSGTTLVEQIIASHSRVTGGGELSVAFQELNVVYDDHRRREQKTFDMSRERVRKLGETIEGRMRETFPDADVITDKSLGSYDMIGPIKAIFPNAKIIVVRRDPRDSLLSMYKNNFEEGRHLYTNNLHDLGVFYHGFVETLDFWREKLPGSFYEIGYEALIADPEAESRKLIAACGLEWEDQCLSFHENKRRVQTLSVHQVRQPIYTSSTKAWQRYEGELGELFDALGPEFDPRVAG